MLLVWVSTQPWHNAVSSSSSKVTVCFPEAFLKMATISSRSVAPWSRSQSIELARRGERRGPGDIKRAHVSLLRHPRCGGNAHYSRSRAGAPSLHESAQAPAIQIRTDDVILAPAASGIRRQRPRSGPTAGKARVRSRAALPHGRWWGRFAHARSTSAPRSAWGGLQSGCSTSQA